MAQTTGGLSNLKNPDTATQELVDKVRNDFKTQSGCNVTMFQLIGYKTQVVAGTMYFAKVQHENTATSYVHLKIWQRLPSDGGAVVLESYEDGKTREDEIKYF